MLIFDMFILGNGCSPRSYGINVARLAGLPQAVIVLGRLLAITIKVITIVIVNTVTVIVITFYNVIVNIFL